MIAIAQRIRRVHRVLPILCLLAGTATPAAAHEVPPRVTVLAFVRPEGSTLRMLVRVPLEAMRDIEWPLQGPGYLVLDDLEPLLREAATLWVADYLTLYEDGIRLADERISAIRISTPADRSFTSWDAANAHLDGTLPADVELAWQQALIDIAFDVPITSDRARFSIRPDLAHLGLRTETILRFLPPDGRERVLRYEGDPGLVRLDPRWYQAFASFLVLGFEHILGGLDHLLFVLCLVLPVRRLRPLLAIVTAFTVAHSITLAASALGLAPAALWFPPLIETLIALSIVWLALENIAVALDRGAGRVLERRWRFAFGFGLVHGFAFSFLLRDSLQLAGSHLAGALLAFNLGVELGQVVVLAAAIPLLALLFRHVPARPGTIIVSALVAHSAWHWMADRFEVLRQYRIAWPAFDAVLALALLRALLLLLVAGAAAWALSGLFRRWAGDARARVDARPGAG